MYIENQDRQDISDFERALNLKSLDENNIFSSMDEFSTALSLSKKHIYALLKAAKIKDYPSIWNAISSPSQLDIQNTYELTSLLEKSDEKVSIANNRLKRLKRENKKLAPKILVKDLIKSIKGQNQDIQQITIFRKNKPILTVKLDKNSKFNIRFLCRKKDVSKEEALSALSEGISKIYEEK
jgi:ParB family chromosome partitioning protein